MNPRVVLQPAEETRKAGAATETPDAELAKLHVITF
jgi:hypothetical protein